jgi:hypothetical protein
VSSRASSVLCRPMQRGQEPRPLHESATTREKPQPSQRQWAQPFLSTPQERVARSSLVTKRGRGAPASSCSARKVSRWSRKIAWSALLLGSRVRGPGSSGALSSSRRRPRGHTARPAGAAQSRWVFDPHLAAWRARGCRPPPPRPCVQTGKERTVPSELLLRREVQPAGMHVSPYYLRFSVMDRPNVIARSRACSGPSTSRSTR